MKFLFFLLFLFIVTNEGCSQSHHEKSFQNNVEIHLNVKKMDDCHFFCYFLEVTVTNNNGIGVFMPFFDRYNLLKIYNDKGISILSTTSNYEYVNKQSNYGLRKEDTRSLKMIDSLENIYNPLKSEQGIIFSEKFLDNIFQEDMFTYYVSKSKLKYEELNNLPEFTKNTIKYIKYGSIAFIPANSSRKLFIPINYLFQNFVVEGYPIKPFYEYGHPEDEDVFKQNFSHIWQDYKKVRTNKVTIILGYDFEYVSQFIQELDKFVSPISYEEEASDSIVISKSYPKKLLDKFYLLKRIQPDTLELDLSGY